jgi:large subunit ribosomal protein L15
MKLNELAPAAGSKKDVYRRGRGIGSGNGKTSQAEATRARTHAAAARVRALKAARCRCARRIPKRGFVNNFATKYSNVNVELAQLRLTTAPLVDA